MNAESLIRCAGFTAAAAPLAVALIARLGLGGAPVAASASHDVRKAPVIVAEPLPTLTPEQRGVQQYAAAALAQPFAASPMHRVVEESRVADTLVPAAPVVAPPPKFDVKSVIISSRQSLATINGKLRRIGDEVEPGWRLAAIDTAAGVLLLTGDDGRRIEVSISHLIR